MLYSVSYHSVVVKRYLIMLAKKLVFRITSWDGTLERIVLSRALPSYNKTQCVKSSTIVIQDTSKRFFSSVTIQKSQHDEHNIVHSPFPDVRVPNVPFSKFIWDDNATLRGNKIALVRSIAKRLGIRL